MHCYWIPSDFGWKAKDAIRNMLTHWRCMHMWVWKEYLLWISLNCRKSSLAKTVPAWPAQRRRIQVLPIAPSFRLGERHREKKELPLPMPFELPTNFNVSIQQCLDKEHLTGKAWSKFITAIAHCIFKHKSYPTQDEYKHVAEMMVKKWKFLQTKAGYVSSSCAPYFKFSGDISHEQHLKYLAAECCKVN